LSHLSKEKIKLLVGSRTESAPRGSAATSAGASRTIALPKTAY
jgi:hypothetical protein